MPVSYYHLTISEDVEASLAIEQLIYELNANQAEIRKDLPEYCKTDTFALVRVMEKLEAFNSH
jgi:hypothetical protein